MKIERSKRSSLLFIYLFSYYQGGQVAKGKHTQQSTTTFPDVIYSVKVVFVVEGWSEVDERERERKRREQSGAGRDEKKR